MGDLAARFWARRGSTITASMASKARAALSRRAWPIIRYLRGIKDGDIWGPTDVYGVRLPLPGDSQPLVLGQVLTGMQPTDPPVIGKQNEPMMPVAWTKSFATDSGKKSRVFTTTMGASQDLSTEGTRRMLVNACLWAVGKEAEIPAKSNVDLVGDYQPHPFGFGTAQKGVKPSDHALGK